MILKWTFRYNENTGKCEDFSHFGCSYNRDSYESIDECQANCASIEEGERQSVRYPGKEVECSLPTKVHFYFPRENTIHQCHHPYFLCVCPRQYCWSLRDPKNAHCSFFS